MGPVGNCDDAPTAGSGVSRRQLLAVTGGVGMSAFLAACGGPSQSTAAPTSSPPHPAPPTPAPTAVTAALAPVTESAAPLTTGVMLCRASWGARPAYPGGRAQTVDRMTLHHSAVPLPDNRDIIARLQQHQRYHQIDKGWVDIAYHVAVDRNGNIFQLRDTAIAGDTATDYDTTGHFLVLAEGNFDEEAVSEAQLASTALVFAWATQQFGLTVDTLAGHRDVATGTSCPGENLELHLTSGDLQRRISDLLSGEVELQSICGPEADARVAGIPAGR